MLALLSLTCVLFVEGLPLVKTSFSLGSETGFCIDIESSGSSIFWNSVLLSSCSEDTSEGDLQQMQFTGSGPITIEGHERCLEVKPKSGGWEVIFRPCWSSLEAQSFTFVEEGCMIKSEKVGLCLAAGSTVSSNGNELTRTLQVVDCDSVSSSLLSWDVHPYNSNAKLTCVKPKTSWKFPKWAAIIFAVFGMITCGCACWFLFFPSFYKEKQKQMELIVRKKMPSKILKDDNLLCPAGHDICVVPKQSNQSCSNCNKLEFREDTMFYLCPICDWLVCGPCQRQISTSDPRSPYASNLSTRKSKEVNVLAKSNINNFQSPRENSITKAASQSRDIESQEQEDKPVFGAPNLLTRIRRSINGTAQQATGVKDGESSDITTPERISKEIVTIRSVVKERNGKLRSGTRRSGFRRDCRSPRDKHYYYSPRRRSPYSPRRRSRYSPRRRSRYSPRRRSPRRYSRWSDSSYSTSTEEEIEYTPVRRPRRQRRWSRRAEYV